MIMYRVGVERSGAKECSLGSAQILRSAQDDRAGPSVFGGCLKRRKINGYWQEEKYNANFTGGSMFHGSTLILLRIIWRKQHEHTGQTRKSSTQPAGLRCPHTGGFGYYDVRPGAGV